MIEYIQGTLISKKPTNAVIDTNGIAFSINITLPTYKMLPAINSSVKIITHLHVKENPMSFIFFGFSDNKERDMFRQIISVSGVGPKTAMSIQLPTNSIHSSNSLCAGSFPIWSSPIMEQHNSSSSNFADLPKNALDYVRRVLRTVVMRINVPKRQGHAE